MKKLSAGFGKANWLYHPFNGEFPTRVHWLVRQGAAEYKYYGKPSGQCFKRFQRLVKREGVGYSYIAEFDAAGLLWHSGWNNKLHGDGSLGIRAVDRDAHQRKIFAYYPQHMPNQVWRAWLEAIPFVPVKRAQRLYGRMIVSYFTDANQGQREIWSEELALNTRELEGAHRLGGHARRPVLGRIEVGGEPVAVDVQRIQAAVAALGGAQQAVGNQWVQAANVDYAMQVEEMGAQINLPAGWVWGRQ